MTEDALCQEALGTQVGEGFMAEALSLWNEAISLFHL